MRYRFRRYGPHDAEGCAALYNTVFQVVPTFVPVDAETVDRSMNQPDSVHAEVAEPGIMVATRHDDDSLAGFVAFCSRRTGGTGPWHGLLRLLCCPLDDPSLATDLVAATRAALLEGGINELRFDGTGGVRFLNGGAVGLPESLAALTPALVRGGLKLTNRELMFAGPTAARLHPRHATVSATLSPVGAEQCSCQAFVGGELVGECWAMLHREVNSHPAARQVAYLQWIGVSDHLRQQGIGNQMLEYTLARLRTVGVHQLQLGTSHDNVDAQAFYQLAGLRVVDQLLSFRSHPPEVQKPHRHTDRP